VVIRECCVIRRRYISWYLHSSDQRSLVMVTVITADLSYSVYNKGCGCWACGWVWRTATEKFRFPRYTPSCTVPSQARAKSGRCLPESTDFSFGWPFSADLFRLSRRTLTERSISTVVSLGIYRESAPLSPPPPLWIPVLPPSTR
jgi:hypothetical protein